MDFFTIFILVILAVIALLALLYVLFFVRPAKKLKAPQSLLRAYAHRGLHGNGVPENSLEAFGLACENGYAIELDVQLSRDGVVTVFHDYTLNRMTGIDKKLCDLDYAELSSLSLAGTDQTIPTLESVLALVGGRVPILVELKGENFDTSLCEKTVEILKDYAGEYCIESFNPLLVGKMKKLLPGIFCGQLFTNVCRDKNKTSLLNVVLTLMGLNFIANPDFIAYNQLDRHTLPVFLTTKLYRAPKFVWTVRNESELDAAIKHGEHPIFENVRPKE